MFMKLRTIIFASLLGSFPLFSQAQSVSPVVVCIVDGEETESTDIDNGEAPLEAVFKANPSDMEGLTPTYEWHFRKAGSQSDFLVRYEEETHYRFTESGTFSVVLKVSFPSTEDAEVEPTTIRVVISESKLEFPNAFSPNGDGINDVYKAKEGYKSIVSFHAAIYNRWGQKLFEWSDPAQGWDGKFKGHDVKDGVYFVHVTAKGADGHQYNIRKDVNLLRGYTERNSQ